MPRERHTFWTSHLCQSLGKTVTLQTTASLGLLLKHHKTAAIGAYPECQILGMNFSRLTFWQKASETWINEQGILPWGTSFTSSVSVYFALIIHLHSQWVSPQWFPFPSPSQAASKDPTSLLHMWTESANTQIKITMWWTIKSSQVDWNIINSYDPPILAHIFVLQLKLRHAQLQ